MGGSTAALAAAFVSRVVEHATAVDEKISHLNLAWPRIVSAYHDRVSEEVYDRELFMRRYGAATRGETEGTTLASLEPSVAAPLPSRSSHAASFGWSLE